MTDAPLLEIRNVKKYYPIRKTRNGTDLAVKAVDQVSLTVNQGEILGLVGESGCGKSTLGKAILRLHEVTDGQIFFHGQDITHLTENRCGLSERKYRLFFRIHMLL